MECNKDEALRSRFIAEKKFIQHDLVGAKKFALRAEHLFPDLEGLPQLIAVLDVHMVAQQKAGGSEIDWYGILQTDASADEATIRKQYRKLALILHPDKNKAIGAEGAFKLISEAWRVLSDKDRKAIHDAKRSNCSMDFSSKKSTRGFCNFSHFTSYHKSMSADNNKRSFWTECPSCKMEFEYLRVHENKRIPCRSCGSVFRAIELAALHSRPDAQSSGQLFQGAGSSCTQKNPGLEKKTSSSTGSSFSFRWGNHVFNSAKYRMQASNTAEVVQRIYDSVRRERIKVQKESQEKAAMERFEAEKEAWKKEWMESKQRRETKGRSREDPVHPKISTKGTEVRESMASRNSDSGYTSRLNSAEREVPDLAERKVPDPLNASMDPQSEPAAHKQEGATKLDKMKEPLWCRTRNNFESNNSCDNTDAFAFSSKRLRVDV
ncbi:hypothetical protein KP509_10G005700 [Ceratopteris richardii]|uniref:J domain-containing protein n=1 Tax=Ceratopteris richardii TaxID=49495 RepID=A0A8T2U1M8_CERRI|nr:hypothetical protein KP509_10G005700 [Ceratopteris richardii]